MRQRRARLLADRRAVRPATSPRYDAKRAAARRQGPVAAAERVPAASASSAGRRAQPLAGDARRRARRSSGWRDWRYQRCPSRPSCSPRPCARCAAPGFAGANVTIPHKEAALALADEATDARARDRRGEHADLRRRRRDPRRQHRRARAARRARGRAASAGARALVLGAGGSARAVVWALRDGRGGRRRASGTGRPARAEALAADLGVPRRRAPARRRPARQLHGGRPARRTPAVQGAARSAADDVGTVRNRGGPRLPGRRHGAPRAALRASGACAVSTAWRSWCARAR